MKNLPIQFVEFREREDEFRTEGGGQDNLQSWISSNIDICRINSARVYDSLSSWQRLFDEREQQHNTMPLLFEVDLHQNAEAKSYRRDVHAILNLRGEKNVIGMTARRKLLVKVDNRSSLRQLSLRFAADAYDEASNKILRAYASIESIDLFHPRVDEYEKGATLKIKLADFGNEIYNQACARNLHHLCEEFNQPCDPLIYAEGLVLYQTKAVSKGFVERIATLDGVLSVQPMPYMTVDLANDEQVMIVPSETPQDGVEYPVVGLLDTAVKELDSIRPWMEGPSEIPDDFDPADVSTDHGTMVSSILLYGDALCGEERTGTGPCKIRSCAVNTSHFIVPENECLDLIKEAIAKHPDIKIWNSAMGSNREAPYDEISDYAKALDWLQQKHNILICKSAGNKDGEENRITNGADSLLSLVVGATTKETNQDGDVVENWSSISRVGLAAGSVIKPDLANLGGDRDNPIKVISENDMIAMMCGTSFATPRISAMAADIAFKLGEKYNPLLVKALLIHGATYPNGMEDDELEDRVRKVGFGIPQSVKSIMLNDEDEITMIFPCHFQKGYEYQVAKFVYPEGLIEDNHFTGDITLSLVAQPILDFNQAAEYCQTDVEVGLYTYANENYVDLMDENTPRTFRNSLRLEGCENVLLEDRYSKKRNQGGSELWECNRIEKSHKYSPIKKFHVNLENMTDANKQKVLDSNRHWALKLKANFREEVVNKVAPDDLQFDAYMVMTIRDPKRRGVVYDQTMNQLNTRNFTHYSVDVRQDIEIGSGE